MNRHKADPSAAELLQRAYSLGDGNEAKLLYRDWAKTYDRTMLEGLGYLTPKKTAELLAEHMGPARTPVLDVGSGTGLAGACLRQAGFELLDALDFSPQMLEVARQRSIYRNFIEADLNKPLTMIGDCQYMALICTGTFTHAHVGAGCLPELFRILVPGGLIACTVHKDVWEPAGFEDMTANLEREGVMQTVSRQEGGYYTDSKEPEGWYVVWQKAG